MRQGWNPVLQRGCGARSSVEALQGGLIMREDCLHARTYRVVEGGTRRFDTVTEFGDTIQYSIERVLDRCAECERDITEIGRRRVYYSMTTNFIRG
jgi:hypothetical protein